MCVPSGRNSSQCSSLHSIADVSEGYLVECGIHARRQSLSAKGGEGGAGGRARGQTLSRHQGHVSLWQNNWGSSWGGARPGHGSSFPSARTAHDDIIPGHVILNVGNNQCFSWFSLAI